MNKASRLRRAKANSAKSDLQPEATDFFIYNPDNKDRIEMVVRSSQRVPRLLWRSLLAGFLTFAIIAIYISLRWLDLSHVFVANTNAAPVNLQKKITSTAITTESADRINILLLGVGDSNHAGADLSDTMMVLSIDPHTHTAAMVGIPRDLYVKIPGRGYDKINAAHALGELSRKGGGPTLAKQVVSNTLGIPIHYFVRTDFTGLKDAVDRLGEVSVDVPEALSDPEYPCANNEKFSCGFSIRAGQQTLSGAVALQYVRCRKGNCGNDFGRARRQQQVLLSMRDKALSLGTLSSPQKIADLVKIIGSHIRTDISIDETKTLYDVLKQVNQSDIETKVLDNSENNLVKTATIGGMSVVVPLAGETDYREIQAYVRNLFFDSHIVAEVAPISLINATGNPTRTQSLCRYLKSFRYNVVSCETAQSKQLHSTVSAIGNNQMPYTLQYLSKRFKVSSVAGLAASSPPTKQIQLSVGSDFSDDLPN